MDRLKETEEAELQRELNEGKMKKNQWKYPNNTVVHDDTEDGDDESGLGNNTEDEWESSEKGSKSQSDSELPELEEIVRWNIVYITGKFEDSERIVDFLRLGSKCFVLPNVEHKSILMKSKKSYSFYYSQRTTLFQHFPPQVQLSVNIRHERSFYYFN